MKNKKGFTLAEVLITLTIIGVVAALTLPVLMANVQKNALEKQTVKFYSRLHDAVAINKVEGDGVLKGINNDFIASNFDIAGKCKVGECTPEEYSFVDGVSTQKAIDLINGGAGNDGKGGDLYMLKDGTVCNIGGEHNWIFFDVNGAKGPNQLGYDAWFLQVFPDGSIDDIGLTPEVRKKSTADEMKTLVKDNLDKCKKGLANNYGGCFGHFMRNGFKFDY